MMMSSHLVRFTFRDPLPSEITHTYYSNLAKTMDTIFAAAAASASMQSPVDGHHILSFMPLVYPHQAPVMASPYPMIWPQQHQHLLGHQQDTLLSPLPDLVLPQSERQPPPMPSDEDECPNKS